MSTNNEIIEKKMGNLTEEQHIDTVPNFCKLCVLEMLTEARADTAKACQHEAHPFTESPKAQERKVEYDFSTKEWAEKSEGDWLANTYIPMRD